MKVFRRTAIELSTVPDEPSEAELVARAQADRAEFAPLYRLYADLVYRYCYRRLGDADASADATSQIFIKAITALPGCNPEKFRSWLFAIAHNVTIDAVRARKPGVALSETFEPMDHAPGPEDEALRQDEGARLRAMIGNLPPDQRRILEYRLAGLSTIEIAEAMGKQRGAIDTAQCRALQRLRAMMTPSISQPSEKHHVTR